MPQLEMQVRPGRQLARITDQRNRFAGYDILSDLLQESVVMFVDRYKSVPVLQRDHVAEFGIVARVNHGTVKRGEHAFFRAGYEVYTIVAVLQIIMRRDSAVHGFIEKDIVCQPRPVSVPYCMQVS